ncbi:MAG: FeoA family protein [Verrucomicrobiota bacterium]
MHETTLALLKPDEKATVAALHGGDAFQHRLRSVGLKEGKLLRVVASHHFAGPLVVEIERRHITIGRGMARKIVVTRAP